MKTPVRIFDKTKKQMLYPDEGTGFGVMLSMHGEVVQFQNGVFHRLLGCVVMHLTPHPADDGKRIWEGDICDFDIVSEYGSQVPARGFMAWSREHSKWNLDIVSPKNMLTAGMHSNMRNVRAIGDIYTTPDLLKQAPSPCPIPQN